MKRALAVDGGNSKTDVVVLSAEGDVLGFARGRRAILRVIDDIGPRAQIVVHHNRIRVSRKVL